MSENTEFTIENNQDSEEEIVCDLLEFPIEELIDCARREVDFRKAALENFEEDSRFPDTKEHFERDLRLMESIHQYLQFDFETEKIATRLEDEANFPMLEESRC